MSFERCRKVTRSQKWRGCWVSHAGDIIGSGWKRWRPRSPNVRVPERGRDNEAVCFVLLLFSGVLCKKEKDKNCPKKPTGAIKCWESAWVREDSQEQRVYFCPGHGWVDSASKPLKTRRIATTVQLVKLRISRRTFRCYHGHSQCDTQSLTP